MMRFTQNIVMKKIIAALSLLTLSAGLLLAQTGDLPRLLRDLDEGVPPGQTYEIQEQELNQFFEREISQQRLTAVKGLQVQLFPGRFIADMTIDIDQLELEQSMSTTLFRSMFQGVQTLKLEGQFQAQNGIGHYQTLKATLNNVALPVTMVDYLLRELGSEQSPPFDPTKPFQMPKNIRSVEIEKGAAIIRS